MEHARGHRDRLDLVILADALRPLLAQTRAHALDIGEDHRLPPAATDKPVEDDHLEKRLA